MIKVIYLDFDGTTYSHSLNKIPESTVKAIQSAQNNGIKVVLATGRSLSEVKRFNLSGVVFDAYVANNGQAIYDKNQKLIYIEPINGELLNNILFHFNEKKIPILLATVDDVYINFNNEHVQMVQNFISTPLPRVDTYKGEDIIMACAFIENEEIRKEVFKMAEYGELTYWNEGAVDIILKGASKAKGIKMMNDILFINKDECLAIGDGENDLEMMKYAGTSIAVGNALDSVKEIATYVSDDIDNDGIYNSFKHFKLL